MKIKQLFVISAIATQLNIAITSELSEFQATDVFQTGQPGNMKTSIQRIQRDPGNGTVTLIKGNLYSSIDTIQSESRNQDKQLYQSLALDFMHHYRTLFKLNQPYRELNVSNTQIDKLDYKHIRLQQVYNDIPVWDSEIIVHVNADEIVYLAGGHYIPSPDTISLSAAFNETRAIDYALNCLPKVKKPCPQCTAKQIIYHDDTISPRLAYLVETNSKFSGSYKLILSAETGQLLTRIPHLQTVDHQPDSKPC
ncbi:MAG: hypothetical protein K0U68_00440 [Gammaproteobacteria bacterium]|nr:hypothetical protein [Gammaproteobacteria bacterium]